jgi:ESCRT-II complex subunit VPS36
MDYWKWKTSGTALEAEEVCLLTQHGVALYNKDVKTQWRKGKLSLTTHQLIYQDDTDPTNILQLPLELVRRAGQAPSTSSGFGPFSSPKVIIPLPEATYVKLSFRSGGADSFFSCLVKALEKKAWMQPAATSSKLPSTSGATRTKASINTTSGDAPAGPSMTSKPLPPAPRSVGIAGVQQASAQSAAMNETLRDVDDVMNKASTLVANIRRLRERNEATAAAGAAAGSETAAERTKIESIESTLGLGTLVARNGKGSSESQFYKDLALELHTWMTHERNAKLFNDMPVVPLIELFALYNKARGGDLVSPLDVLNACTHMTEKMPGSRYDLVTLSSGRKALVNKDDSLLLAKLAAVLGPQLVSDKPSPVQEARKMQQQKGGVAPLVQVPTAKNLPSSAGDLKFVSDVQLAERMQVSTEVAADILNSLEQKGYLCCGDTGFDCFVYYWNIFVF